MTQISKFLTVKSLLQLWWSAVILVVGQIGPVTIGNSVENGKNLQNCAKCQTTKCHRVFSSYPASDSGVTEVRSIRSLRAGAPAEAGEDDDEGDEVKEGGYGGVDHLHLEEGEGQLDLDVVPDPEQVEEGPEDRHHEAGHHHEEEPVIVPHTKQGIYSAERDTHCRSGTGHAHNSQDLSERKRIRILHFAFTTRQSILGSVSPSKI